MAKKKVEVNEDMLKDIMVGDIPVFGRERPNYQEPKVIETEDSDTDSDEGTEAIASKPSTPKPRKLIWGITNDWPISLVPGRAILLPAKFIHQ